MIKKLVTQFVSVLLITNNMGCSTIIGSGVTYGKFSEDRDLTQSLMSHPQKHNVLLNRKNGIYVDTTPIKVSDQKTQLLEAFPETVVFSSKSLMSIREIADKVTKLTSIPVSYNDIAGQPQVQGASPRINQSVVDSAEEAATLGLDSLPILPGMSTDQLYSNSNPGSGFPSDIPMIDARFTGKLADFLDHVAGRTGLFWKFDNEEKRIVLFRYESKTFALHILPGTITANADLRNTSTTSSTDANNLSSSQSGQTINLKSDTKPWDESLKVIQKMLSRNGRLEGNEALGSVVVTDTPVVLAEIGRYVDQINKIMSRQVSFDISIYDIEIQDDNKFGIDWNFVWNEAGKFFVGYQAVSVAAAGVESGANFIADFGNSPAAGSEAFIRALETQGRLSLKTHQQTMTLNNTPVPIKVAEETTYLASATSGTTSTTTVGTLTTQLLPGKVVSGLTMTLLPRVFDANQMMLQMSMDITDLRSIETITSGESSIQAPKIGTKSFIQRVAVKNNETLIMSGFDQNRNSVSNDRSLDIPSGLARSEKHIITVVMITPRITEGVSIL
jgi:type IVB pilus formation R64 PilN family outer membrane protein